MLLRRVALSLSLLVVPSIASSQAPGRFPPDSLINTKVIPHATPVIEVIGMMRNFSGDLGVRCQFCHVGQEGQPLSQFDFASDDKRTKRVARQMMLMVQEVNRRLDTLPARPAGTTALRVTCETCHHGLSRPQPLALALVDIGMTSGADSTVRAYQALRNRYYGRAAYDFGETSLNTAAFRLARAGKYEEALALLKTNETYFPTSAPLSISRGNVLLMRADTAGAESSFREAIRRDPNNEEAKGRLRAIGKAP
jgi:hypothetical protein